MTGALKSYIRVVDRFNGFIGVIVMFGLFVIMAILLWSTASKVLFVPSLWTLDMAQFAMMAYFVLGGAYSIQLGSNVRMDLFYDNWSPKRKAWTDAVTVFFLITYLAVLFEGGVASTAYSLGYYGTEPYSFFAGLVSGSEDIGRLEIGRTVWRPYLWPIKVIMCCGILLMLLQAVSELFKDILRIRGEDI